MTDTILNLRQICQKLDENEPEINKNFWAVNMHGDELETDFTVPRGIRIIMFCYPGRKLDICPRFDIFNWSEIFLNENASFNYCTFIANLSRYSSLKNHFCVYEEGQTITDLVFTPDKFFRSGIYKLPVQAAVYEKETNQIYLSSSDIFGNTAKYIQNVKKIVVDKNKTAKLAKDRDSDFIIFSKHFDEQRTTLSNLIKKLRTELGKDTPRDLTLLLLTCRTGVRRYEGYPNTVHQELENMVKQYEFSR